MWRKTSEVGTDRLGKDETSFEISEEVVKEKHHKAIAKGHSPLTPAAHPKLPHATLSANCYPYFRDSAKHLRVSQYR